MSNTQFPLSSGLRRAARACLVSLALAQLSVAACSAGQGDRPGQGSERDAGSFLPGDGSVASDSGSVLSTGDAALPDLVLLVISPDRSVQTIDALAPKPITFTATLSDGSAAPAELRWTSVPKELGTIDAKTGKLTPSGVAGVLTITASAGSLRTSTTLVLSVSSKQEGDPDQGKPSGAGGVGGVGGDGGGSKLTNKALRAALDDKTPTRDAELVWLYPYDGTVWPRGLPAPLLQWQHGAHAPLAVKIHLEVDKSAFVYDGYFGAPSALTAGAPIDRLPIPQAVWRAATQSGRVLVVTLTVAANDGAGGYAAYTAAKKQTWTIAPASLKGVVYYNSYGTKLAKNFNGAVGGDGRFGGATLAISGDSFDPTLVAGSNSDDSSGCRVCHTVASGGSVLIAQRVDNMVSSAYDLKNKNKERSFTNADGKLAWSALSPDGTLALGNAGPPGNDPSNTSSLDVTALYQVSDAAAVPTQGLTSFVTQAAMPVFSPDAKQVAFNLFAGPSNGKIKADGYSLVVMDISKTKTNTYEFANPIAVYTSAGGQVRPGWPFFLPDQSGLIFELELQPANNGELFMTRSGARGELWWTDLKGEAHALDRANGKGYLPSGPLGHDDDSTLQYEPTVAPIVAGGYAWVVFTSRRLYGNVATREPFESDPRNIDLNPDNSAGPTTKKLWVSAVDVPAKPGSDPSHPAFYLPAQELYAGNSRGFWVLDACHENGVGCETGDECCGGYCRSIDEFGKALCSDEPPPSNRCAAEYDKCEVTTDCCQSAASDLTCIAGRCAGIVVVE